MTLPKGMPVRDVYLMGVNVINSFIWGDESPSLSYGTHSDATISSPYGGQPYHDNTATPNSRIQSYEGVTKTPMTFKNINSN